jgi:glyceraldehyde 3-phosphate dehydrogenase
LIDLTVELATVTTAPAINDAFAARADTGELEGILQLSFEPLVSSDVIKSPYSAVVDAGLTTVVAGTQAKIVAWYDNEWAYSTRLVELALQVAAPVPALV